MAKGEGFEPSIRDKPYTRLAGERLQPLGHPFIRLLFSSRFELLASPVARNERAFTLPFAFVQVLFFKSCIFFASPTANAAFAAAICHSSGAFFGYLGSPYFAIAQYGLWVALFRYRSIRAFGYAYFARWAQYGFAARLCARFTARIRRALVPGLRFAYPGLCSGAPSGR